MKKVAQILVLVVIGFIIMVFITICSRMPDTQPDYLDAPNWRR